MGLFKDLLGGLAEGYIEERGAQGTLEDLGKLASNVKGLFSTGGGNGYNEEAWNNLLKEVNSLVDDLQFNEAENAVIDYYNNYENGKPDTAYYNLRARISLSYYECLPDDSEEIPNIENEIIGYIKELEKYNLGSDYRNNLRELQKDFQEAKKIHKEGREYIQKWDRLTDNLEEFIEKKQYTKAIEKLNTHYSKHESGKDFWYFYWQFNILKNEIKNLEFGENIEEDLKVAKIQKVKLNTALLEMQKRDEGTHSEQIEDAEEWNNAIGEMIDRMEIHLLINNKKYDEANECLNNKFPNKGATYYQILSRLESLLLLDKVESKGPRKEIEELVESSKFNMRLALELTDDEQTKQKIKEAVIPRVAKATQYLEATSQTESPSKFSAAPHKQVNQEESCSKHSSNELTSVDREYFDEYKACLDNDGIISEREKRLLDRLRKSLGISDERARELEEMCKESLSPEEQEYAEEIKACLADDGLISERERRLLDRLAKSLNISPERAKEIEKTIKC